MSASSRSRAGSAARSLGLLAVAALAALAGSLRSPAQLLPLGPDFQVNDYTTGSQQAPLVTAAPDGSFTVVWCCGMARSTADQRPLVARRFDAGGQPQGAEFAVSQSEPRYPSGVGADAEGDFVVVWGAGSAGCPACWLDYVKARRFTAAGQPLAGQFAVSDPPGTAYTGGGRVAVAADGGFVVAWSEYGAWAQRFDPDALPLGPEFAVGGEQGYSYSPVVAPQPAGGFVIAWEDFDATLYPALVAQRFDGGGQPVGARIEVAARETRPWTPDLASGTSGDFVVAWIAVPAGSDGEVRARRFDASGASLGPAVAVDSYDAESVWSPAVGRAAGGGLVVAWESYGSPGTDSSSSSLQGRLVAADGTRLGLQLQLNGWTTGYQSSPAVAALANGDLVVTWGSETSPGTDTSNSSVLARRFRLAFFMDGFETGDASRWSALQPLARAHDRARQP